MNWYAIKIPNYILVCCHVETVDRETGANQHIALDSFTEDTDNVYTTARTVFTSRA